MIIHSLIPSHDESEKFSLFISVNEDVVILDYDGDILIANSEYPAGALRLWMKSVTEGKNSVYASIELVS